MVVTATNKELQFDWIMHSPNVRHSSRSFYIASLMVYIKTINIGHLQNFMENKFRVTQQRD